MLELGFKWRVKDRGVARIEMRILGALVHSWHQFRAEEWVFKLRAPE